MTAPNEVARSALCGCRRRNPNVGANPGRDAPYHALVCRGVKGELLSAEDTPKPHAPAIDVPRGDIRMSLDPLPWPT